MTYIPHVALTCGDPNGVGPEVALAALLRGRRPTARYALVGPRGVWEAAAAATGLRLPTRGAVHFVEPAGALGWRPAPGKVRVDAARVSLAALAAAADGCVDGTYDAVVTAPICKAGWERAGVTVPGHTEWLAERAGTREVGMMLLGKGLRVTLATRHLALRDVPDALTPAGLQEIFRLTADALPWLGVADPCIAVCGLNPHCGDGGVMGDEDQQIIAPAIRRGRKRGWPLHGPLPGDTVFRHAVEGRWDVVIAMYHDQGLAPLKVHAFETGVNLTLGLPYVRTSPDHGTAFDRAGSGSADPSSMRAAIRLAVELAGRPHPWGRR